MVGTRAVKFGFNHGGRERTREGTCRETHEEAQEPRAWRRFTSGCRQRQGADKPALPTAVVE